ncbi:MAG TPA: trypsin-like peptidase domain-containing protein [Candidatus Polarisedimenticolia bacterium]|nr:trypsin-like peptidase domain-containing protein [Candidatus Polarisedimenticolia bacterium]
MKSPSKTWKIAFLVIAALAVVIAISAVPSSAGNGRAYPELPSAVSTEGPTQDDARAMQADLTRRLSGELPPSALESAIKIQIPAEEIGLVDNGKDTPLKIGVVKPLTPGVEVSGLSRGQDNQPRQGPSAPATPTADGGFTWAVAIRSEEAGAIRVHVEGMSLPRNAEMYFYALDGQAYGPYKSSGPNGTGEFWTSTVFGTEGVLQVRLSAPVTAADLAAVAFKATEAGFITRKGAGQIIPTPDAPPPPGICGNATCIVDANCYANANGIKDAIAKMEWIQGAFIYTCTGGLLNDSNPSSDSFFLTANHCLSKNNTAANVNFYWRFRTNTCNGTCPSNNGWPYQSSGSSIAATNRKGDFTLLRLSSAQAPPSGSVYLGWTSAPVANSNGTAMRRVSNPQFGTQVYSEHSVDTGAPTCSGWPRGERIYSRDTLGGIDGGSSGSPITNTSNQVVGQLSGTCGSSPSSTCSSGPGGANATVDGAFAFYFATVQPILAP